MYQLNNVSELDQYPLSSLVLLLMGTIWLSWHQASQPHLTIFKDRRQRIVVTWWSRVYPHMPPLHYGKYIFQNLVNKLTGSLVIHWEGTSILDCCGHHAHKVTAQSLK